MPQRATIKFVDKDSGQPGFVAVRAEGEVVGLAISLQDDGDMEVFLDGNEVAELVAALQKTMSEA